MLSKPPTKKGLKPRKPCEKEYEYVQDNKSHLGDEVAHISMHCHIFWFTKIYDFKIQPEIFFKDQTKFGGGVGFSPTFFLDKKEKHISLPSS